MGSGGRLVRWLVLAGIAGLVLLGGLNLVAFGIQNGAALLFPDHPYNVGYRVLNEKFLGASQLIVQDLKEEFAKEHIFPLLRAGAVYERKYLLGTSIARPLIAKRQIEIARKVKADAVSLLRMSFCGNFAR